jgi:ABC-type lipoprotein release transport system permease subunit
MLYGVQPTDPVTFGVVPVILALTAIAASYLPARRAASIDPNAAMRVDG